ncbi:hypothetical protein TWF281_008877 [Arthrobotrys megalospora]
MRPLRFSGCVGVWASVQALILQVNHVPVATAAMVEIPVEPDLVDYLKLNLQSFKTIGHQLDRLKTIREEKCPTGAVLDPASLKAISGGHVPVSLSYTARKLRLAQGQLDNAIELMQHASSSDPTKLVELLSQYGFQNIQSVEAARHQLSKYHDVFADDVSKFGGFSRWLGRFPAQTYTTGDTTMNLIDLSWRIEGASEYDVDEETNKLKVNPAMRDVTIKEFRAFEIKARNGEELATEAALWAAQNVNYEFKQFMSNGFTLATVFQQLQKWYDCWEPPLSIIVTTLTDKLGPFPIWERED